MCTYNKIALGFITALSAARRTELGRKEIGGNLACMLSASDDDALLHERDNSCCRFLRPFGFQAILMHKKFRLDCKLMTELFTETRTALMQQVNRRPRICRRSERSSKKILIVARTCACIFKTYER